MSVDDLNDDALNEALNEQLDLVTPDMKVVGAAELPLNVVEPDFPEEEDDDAHLHPQQQHQQQQQHRHHHLHSHQHQQHQQREDEDDGTDRQTGSILAENDDSQMMEMPDTKGDSIAQALQDESSPGPQNSGSGKKTQDMSSGLESSGGGGGNKTISNKNGHNKSGYKNNNNNNNKAMSKSDTTKDHENDNENENKTDTGRLSSKKDTTLGSHNNNNNNNNNSNDTNDLTSAGLQDTNETTTDGNTTNTAIENFQYQPGLPRRYEVLVQARVREKKDVDSSHITDLPEGTTVTVAEIEGRRARIITPIHGWLSIKSKFGAKILLPLDENHSKVGHQVFITDQQSNARYSGKIVDYNEIDCKHVVRLNDGQELLVDIKAPNIKVVKDTEHMREARNRLSGDAPAFDPKASKQSNSLYLFHKLLWKDHPDFVREEHERAQMKQEQRWLAQQQHAQAQMSEMAAHPAPHVEHGMHLHPTTDGGEGGTMGYNPMIRSSLMPPNATVAPEHSMRYPHNINGPERREGEYHQPMPEGYYQQMRANQSLHTDKNQMPETTQQGETQPPKPKKRVRGLIVLRGLPGSGKSTLAKKLAARHGNARICTEDKYHWSGKEDGVGEYKFRPELVFSAREWCTNEIRACIKQHVDLIILDNHNARISMYEDHIQYAVRHGYRFRIVEFIATEELIDKYRQRSYKKFPREVFVKLLKLWEKDPRAELVNPAFDEGSRDHHIDNHFGNTKDKEKHETHTSNKEDTSENQKEVSKKSKESLRGTNDLNGSADATSHHFPNNNYNNDNHNHKVTNEREWNAEQSQLIAKE